MGKVGAFQLRDALVFYLVFQNYRATFCPVLPQNERFCFQTDVKSYYASIDHIALIERLARHIDDRAILDLMIQFMRHTSERGGRFWEFERGISLGCPLSPLMGAFFCTSLTRMGASGLFYVRFRTRPSMLSTSLGTAENWPSNKIRLSA